MKGLTLNCLAAGLCLLGLDALSVAEPPAGGYHLIKKISFGAAAGGGIFGIASPLWQVMHWTLVTSAAGLPMPAAILSLASIVICIISRAVFFGAFSSVAKSFRPPCPSCTWQ